MKLQKSRRTKIIKYKQNNNKFKRLAMKIRHKIKAQKNKKTEKKQMIDYVFLNESRNQLK